MGKIYSDVYKDKDIPQTKEDIELYRYKDIQLEEKGKVR